MWFSIDVFYLYVYETSIFLKKYYGEMKVLLAQAQRCQPKNFFIATKDQ